MRSSKIISKEDSGVGVLHYEPQKVQVDTQAQAKNFKILQKVESTESFKINDLVSEQIGLAKAEIKKQDKVVEEKVLDKVKEVQERAYKEAYDLGMIEGRQKAYEDYKATFEAQLSQFAELMDSIAGIKKNVLDSNEAQMVDIMYYMAKKIALDHIESNPARIVPVLKELVETLNEEEKVYVRVSEDDFKFLEELKKEMKREFDFLKKITLISSLEIKSGGCVFETKNGLKDATIEERLEKLWDILKENKPKSSGES